ncbi:AAA family ATPase [Kitasatospora sp. NPDC058965]|uniref:AAA family ATPase n=1 Tax=Kitasatospora sp. NPDC058965 TaxID=3346682 RepID=UPI00369A82C3
MRTGPRLILLCGLPGAGKTTLATRLAADLPAVRLCPDEWLASLALSLYDEAARDRLERRLWHHAQELLRLGQSVVLEFGFWGRAERDAKRAAARALGIPVELRYLTAPFDELVRRVEARGREGRWDTVPITRAMMESYLPLFEAPTAAELALFEPPAPGGRTPSGTGS